MKNENIQKAVELLEETKVYAVDLLKDEAMLGLRVSNTMQTLINGLKHVGGFAGDVTSSPDSSSAVQPAKTFMGLDLEELDKQNVPAKVDVPVDEKEQFKKEVTDIYANFLTRDEKNLQEALTKEQLLGVAKLAGVPVADPIKQNVTLKLIREIKEAMEAAITLQAEKDAKIQELDNSKTGDNVLNPENTLNTEGANNENQSGNLELNPNYGASPTDEDQK